MANYTTIEAEARPRAGKGAARATRRQGKVPGVIYGAKQTPTLIALEPKLVLKEIQSNGWRSRLFEIKVDGAPPTRALIRDVQLHPVSDRPEHVDFQRLAPGERIRVAVAVHFTGEATSPGLKRGGVLNVVRHTIECLCDPDHVPAAFEADLSTLDINDNVRWHDLKGTAEVRPTVERDFVVATVAPPTKGAEPVAAEAAATAVAAAPAKGGKAAAPAKAAPPKAGAAPAKGAAAPAAKAAAPAKAPAKK
jgi:large subunit ribosomal protein L25